MIDFEEKAITGAANNDLKAITRMANDLRNLDMEMAKAEATLKDLSNSYKMISETMIPEAMAAAGMTEFKLEDGTKVSIQKYYSAKIPETREEEAFRSLEESGNGSLIKSEIKAKFGKGEEERVAEQSLIEIMKKMHIGFDHKRGVHPMTLKAFVKEQIEDGKPIDIELFGVYIGNKTKIGGK